MKYTQNIPTKPGWYWRKQANTEFPTRIRVVHEMHRTFVESYGLNSWHEVSSSKNVLGEIYWSEECIEKPEST